MKIILTNHAKQRMIERNIHIEEIKDTLEFPDYTITKENKIEAYKKMEGKNLKVVYTARDKFIKIITIILKCK